MKKSVKETIIDNAIKLFNERGYYNISLRDIAKETGIAIGNLTYYFKRKENLINTIVSDLQRDYPFKNIEGFSSKQLIDYLVDLIYTAERNRTEIKFYYSNLNQLAMEYNTIYQQHEKFIAQLYYYFLEIFQALRNIQVFHKYLSDEELENYTILFINLLVFWDQKINPNNIEGIPRNDLSHRLINLILVITDNDYKHLFEKHLNKKQDES